MFENLSDPNLSQFALWYHQAGTPNLSVTTAHNAAIAKFTIKVEQSVLPTPSESSKRLMHIPLAFSLFAPTARIWRRPCRRRNHRGWRHPRSQAQACRYVLRCRREAGAFAQPQFLGTDHAEHQTTGGRPSFLASHESDTFSRRQAFNTLLTDAIIGASKNILDSKQPTFSSKLTRLSGHIANDGTFENAFWALALILLSATDIGKSINPDTILTGPEALAAGPCATRCWTISRFCRMEHS